MVLDDSNMNMAEMQSSGPTQNETSKAEVTHRKSFSIQTYITGDRQTGKTQRKSQNTQKAIRN